MFWFIFNFLIVAVPLFLIVLFAMAVVHMTSVGVRSPVEALLDALKPADSAGMPPSREETVRRMEKLAGSAASLCSIVFWLGAVAAACGSLLAAFLCASYALSGGSAASGRALAGLMIQRDGVPYLSVLINCFLGSLIVRILGTFFKRVRETGRPFDAAAASEAKGIGVLLIVAGFASDILGNLLTWAVSLTGAFAFSWESVKMIPAGFFSPLLVGVVVCAVARILEYGAILQEQDDGLL